jgi:sensor c-di-GMP phosphodiesterase-like protein
MFSVDMTVGIGIGIVIGVIATILWLVVFGKDDSDHGDS